MAKHKAPKAHKSKLSLTAICKHTLMVCGVLTTLAGTVGGLREAFIGKGTVAEPVPAVVATAAAPAAPTSSRDIRLMAQAEITKSVTSAITQGIATATTPTPVAPVTQEAPVAPERSFTERLSGMWIWLLLGGLGAICGILMMIWYENRTATIEKGNI